LPISVFGGMWSARYLAEGVEYQPQYPGSPAEDGLFQQLADDGLLQAAQDGWMITWRQVYQLKESKYYTNVERQLGLPPPIEAIPNLASCGSLTDTSFSIHVSTWSDAQGADIPCESICGALLERDGKKFLLPKPAYELVKLVEGFAKRPPAERNGQSHRIAWGRIRTAAKAANARLDDFLHRTIVLTPERLDIQLRKTVAGGVRVVQVTPSFEGCPREWIATFDRNLRVLDRYDLSTPEGICQVVIAPQVREVLSQIKKMSGRRLAGARAEAFLANPIAALGEPAARVIDVDQFEEAKIAAGISLDHFTAYATEGQTGERRETGLLIETAAGAFKRPFTGDDEARKFVALARDHLARRLQIVPWHEHELELLGDSESQLAVIEAALADRRDQPSRLLPDVVFDLSRYSPRIDGIGKDRTCLSPYIGLKSDDEGWLPDNVVTILGFPAAEDGSPLLIPLTDDQRAQLREQIDKAKTEGAKEIVIPGAPTPVSVAEADRVLGALDDAKTAATQGSLEGDITGTAPASRRARMTLLIKPNITSVEYVEKRKAVLSAFGEVELPRGLRSEVSLKRHQEEGLAWLQHLFRQAPEHCRGAVLADDMGLGKTLQLLSLIAWVRQQDSSMPPALVVAPVALLENWRLEAEKFFDGGVIRIVEIYGESIANHRLPPAQIDEQLRSEGLVRFLREGWAQGADLVLTTYETMRDYEFSFAEQKWSVMVCDEAQKIKNPNALVTRAAKKQNARFRVACTGTPVENSLADLWCLFDFIQPGYLGALNEFGTRYRRPIEAKTEEEKSRVEELRSLIAPQVLRRLKKDVASDLPDKIHDVDCKQLQMSLPQRALYSEAVAKYRGEGGAGGNPFPTILGLLQYLRIVCTHPQPYGLTGYTEEPLSEYRKRSPKLDWLLRTLADVKRKGEKALVFCESREVQRLLRRYISEDLGYVADIINGETAADSRSGASRQKRIATFQSAPGFGVIILSPLAVGFGVNIQAANHVIHFSRMWNPAKEDQATDRAYRIGQTKDVHVYTPVVRATDFKTFDVRLDELLNLKRALADDMLNGSGDISTREVFEEGGPTAPGGTHFDSRKLTIHDVDSMTPRFFEAFVAALCAKRGYERTKLTPSQGDGGVDVVALSSDEGELVQCKHSSRSSSEVGWDGIKDVVAGAAGYRTQYPRHAFRLVCATNQYFNANARQQAELNSVQLIDRDRLISLLEQYAITRIDVEGLA
jgi:hypothetical protein